MSGVSFPLSVVLGAVDHWTGPFSSMAAKAQSTFAPLHAAGAGLAALGQSSGIQRLVGGFQSIAEKATELWHVVYELGEATAHAGVEAEKNAARVGTTTKAYQELSFAARLAHVEQGELEGGLGKMTRAMGLVALGNRKADEGFRRLGVHVLDADHKLRPVEVVLGEVADGLNQLDDPLKRNAIASLVFGRGARALTPLLKGGARGLKDAADQADRFGIITEEGVHRSEEFLQAQVRVGAALVGVRNVVGVALLPALTGLVDKVAEFVSSHREEIASYAERFAKGLPETLTTLWHLFETGIAIVKPLAEGFLWLVDAVGPMPVLLTTLGVAVAATVVPALALLVSSFTTLSAALVGTPFGWVVLTITGVVAAILGLMYAGYKLVQNWDAIWGWIKDTAVAAWTFLSKHLALFLGPVGIIMDHWGELKTFFGGLWDWVVDKFAAAWGWISDKLSALGSLVPDWLKSVLGFGGTTLASAAPLAPPGSGAGGKDTVVRVQFENAPKGTRADVGQSGSADVDLSLGYSLLGSR